LTKHQDFETKVQIFFQQIASYYVHVREIADFHLKVDVIPPSLKEPAPDYTLNHGIPERVVIEAALPLLLKISEIGSGDDDVIAADLT
jgi:hypothetical protein